MSLGKERSENIAIWKSLGVRCKYIRFQKEVPPGIGKEPVSEFYLQKQDPPLTSQLKYMVDDLWYTPMGIIWSAHGEIDNVVAVANFVFVRPL